MELQQPTIADLTNMNHDHSTVAKGGNLPGGILSVLPPIIASNLTINNNVLGFDTVKINAGVTVTVAVGITGRIIGLGMLQ